MFDLEKYRVEHQHLVTHDSVEFFIDRCQQYVDNGGRYIDNYRSSKIRDLIKGGRINEGVLYLYYEDEVVAFTGLESYKDKEALMITRYCVYNSSPMPYSAFFLLPEMLKIAKQRGYRHLGGSVNEGNKHLVKMLMSGQRFFNGTPFEPYKHVFEKCFSTFFLGEKQIHNSVEQQFYFFKV